MEILNPIFIIGSGRSGTTILYDLLAGHKELGWFSSYTNKYPQKPELAKLNSLYKIVEISRKYRKTKYFPNPHEGHDIWDYFHPINEGKDKGASPPFDESDVENANIGLMKNTIIKHLLSSGTSRFINKNTRNTRRMLYLYTIFPDCKFIHIIRDGRANINSIINVDWWENLEPWFENEGKTISQLIKEGKNELILGARCWKQEVSRALNDSKKIRRNQYLDIRYEDLTNNPNATIEQILNFSDLDFSNHFRKHVNSFSIKNMNYKYKNNFTKSELDLIENETGDLLRDLKYN